MAGAGELILKFLVADTDAKILRLWDGFVEYQTSASFEKIKSLKYFNNSYLFVHSANTQSFKEFDNEVVTFCKRNGEKIWKTLRNVSTQGLTYRIMFYDQNKPTSIDSTQLSALEKFISRGELVDRTHPKLEITVTYRSEGVGFMGVRLTYHPDYKKVLQPGELRPEVCEALCRLSDPQVDDIFLDPFAGSGAIVSARKSCPFKKMYCNEINEDKIVLLKKKFGHDKEIIIKKSDAVNLEYLKDESVNKIVTDPPWGNFDKAVNIVELYPKMLVEIFRVLAKDGVLVILTSRSAIDLPMAQKWDVLISGRQATIYKLVKRTDN